MFLIDQPYISDFFRQTLKEHRIPVVATPAALQMDLLPGTNLIDPAVAATQIRAQLEANLSTGADSAQYSPLYTTSENALEWIAANLDDTDIPATINLFKDKLEFRRRTKALFPDFFFQGVQHADLATLDVDELKFPFIIKPSVGFFSMGVHKVHTSADWKPILARINAEIASLQQVYPRAVLDTATFILEECIEGDEFAVDVYFDSNGKAVVVGIHQHLFASANDVSDRVYITSKQIVSAYLEEFTTFATTVGTQLGVRNFPVHIELRRQGGSILPIEINPMRFGGWCTTADSTAMAFGFNPYVAYYTQQKPDWSTILQGKDATVNSMVVLDNSTGLAPDEIVAFDYAALASEFERVLELRPIDYRRYNVFGFLFSATRGDNMLELERILQSDLREYVRQ
ncbi:MAG: ATP-grasp domain-containing protein [Desulfuromonadaceae bacterium]|nr:ATP-grasp domain-containing protein [Desulfuromonadaceae bacterium]